MKKSICLLVMLAMSIAAILGGCSGKQQPASQQERLQVYTSIYPMYDFAKKIGGDTMDIVNIVPAGSEPHDWEPSPKDIASITKADVFIYNGTGMEPWVEKLKTTIKGNTPVMVEASAGLPLLEGSNEHEEEDGEELAFDPHVWLNPIHAKAQMQKIRDAFIGVDASRKEYYEEQYNTYAAQCDALDKKYRDTLSRYSNKNMVVAHQAFGYLADAYGLVQVPIEGLNAEAEPSPAKMVEISKFAKENNVKVIFFEELISPKVAEIIAREVGAKTQMLNPLEGLKEEDIKAGKDYFSVMEDNLKALDEALK